MLDDWGFFNFEDYAPLLGKQGLARYRALSPSDIRAAAEAFLPRGARVGRFFT